MAKKNLTGKALAAAAALTLTVSSLGQSASVLGNKVKAAETENYAKLLQTSLFFYDANMCGKQVESKGLMKWRSNCHTSDEVDGGFHDAGDHAMFGLPQGYTASTLGWAYYEFKDAYDSLGVTDHYKTINDYFAKFFRDATVLSGDSVSKFCIQKGLGNTDHAYWGAPELQGDRGGCDWRSSGSGEIAAEYAAALAASYVNFGNADDLKYAKALYKYAKANPSCSDGDCTGFYKSDSSNDDLAWAAGWLYLATKDNSYKSDCQNNQKKIGWVHSWNNVELGAACLAAEIGAGDWNAVNGYLGGQCTGSGYLCMSEWGSARYNTAMQLAALVASKHSSADYTSWCKGQMTYILGQNPKNTCFVTGFDTNSAKNVHHRAASGYQGYDGPDGFHEGVKTYNQSKCHVLIGALAGGPADASGTYSDVIDDYKSNEVALDYNAGLVGAAAGLYSKYKTGTVASSLEGTKSNGVGTPSVTPTTAPTTTPTSAPTSTPTSTPTVQPTGNNQSGGKVLLPSDMTIGEEKGDDGEMNTYAEFKPQGAKTATLYVKVNTTDTEISGEFGTWTGTWDEVFFDKVKVPSDKIVKVTYDIPSKVGSTVKAMIFWPHGDGVTIEKIVLDESGSTSPVPTAAPTSAPTNNPGTSANDVVLLPADMTMGEEKGDDGEMNTYAEFKPQGAKSATLYVKVNTTDTEISGEFGTWTGTWDEVFFDKVKVPSSKEVTVDYTIPAKVGSTVKAMIFWPHGDGVTIEKVVLHKDGAGSTPTAAPTAAPTVKPTTTPTATPTAKPTTAPTQAPSSVKGDTNTDGTVSTADVVTLMQALVGKKTLTGDAKNNADMNDDGRISILDLIMLKNLLLK